MGNCPFNDHLLGGQHLWVSILPRDAQSLRQVVAPGCHHVHARDRQDLINLLQSRPVLNLDDDGHFTVGLPGIVVHAPFAEVQRPGSGGHAPLSQRGVFHRPHNCLCLLRAGHMGQHQGRDPKVQQGAGLVNRCNPGLHRHTQQAGGADYLH